MSFNFTNLDNTLDNKSKSNYHLQFGGFREHAQYHVEIDLLDANIVKL
jgi:hypothetical protein